MIAKVIVDVPTGQTDRLFDYIIPLEWEGIIEKGMRVGVPFGPRVVQGFVTDIKTDSELSLNKLKPIKEVLDVAPILTNELMNLADWLADTTLCFKISAYQVMLPAALKGIVKKELILNQKDAIPTEILKLYENRETISFNEVSNNKQILSKMKQWILDGFIDVNYTVQNKGTIKKQKIIFVQASEKELEQKIQSLDNRAKKQKELLLFLQEKKIVPLSYLLERNIAQRATIKALLEQSIIGEKEEEIYRNPFEGQEFKQTTPLPLTEKQTEAITPILGSIEKNEHTTFLLHGVTGSGKTEIYLQSIEQVLNKGKEAIVLVPEISLTPQMVDRFKGRFGSQVAVLHSGLSVGEKYDEWRKIYKKQVRVVVGARSAIFAPFENLGIIIIDEEHEGSYKQEDNPRYHARDVAIYRGMHYECPVILGSATPSLETYARALKGRYTLLPLLERVNQMEMPKVEIVDMRQELRDGNRSMFSKELFEKLEDRLEKKEQTVLLLNRRGYSTFVMCRDCGYVPICNHCDISLTYHRTNHSLKCHYCGHEEKMPTTCTECNSEHIRFFGTGTQKVEEELSKLLPHARVIRMDVDTTRRKGAHQKLLDSFGQGKGDILLGTQMIAKGLDFPNITLVGVLAADTMLHIPDFRSAERTFQLLTQVSGRAGRHKLPGEVIVQTYNPEHYSIEYVQEHDFIRYFHHEMHVRRAVGYPPYYFLSLIHVSHEQLPKVIEVTEKICTFLRNELSREAQVLGPVASPIARMKDRYRYQCMVKYKNEPSLTKVLKEVLHHYSQEMSRSNLHIGIDMNPQMFM